MKDGFVKPSKQEVERIIKQKAKMQEISGRMAERVQLQELYLEAYLTRQAKQVRLVDFQKVIEEKVKKDEPGPVEIFGGHFSSLAHAISEFDLERRIHYRKACTNEQKLFDHLKREGLTDEQIKKLVEDGTMVKFTSEKQQKDEAKNVSKGGEYIG